MKAHKNNRADPRIDILDRRSRISNETGRGIDFSKAEIGVRVVDGKADIYVFGTKFTDAEFRAIKCDYNNEVTSVTFKDFALAAYKMNDVVTDAEISVDGMNLTISPDTPYGLDMKIVMIFATYDVVVQIVLYNAFTFAPGLSGCHIGIGIRGETYQNVIEGFTAMIALINNDNATSLAYEIAANARKALRAE